MSLSDQHVDKQSRRSIEQWFHWTRPVSWLVPSALMMCLAAPALAHDTWLERVGSTGEATFALGTANRFPRHEEPVDTRVISQAHCVDGQGQRRQLESLRVARRFSFLRASGMHSGIISCSVQLIPLDVELGPETVGVYLKEIEAGPELLRAWELQRRRGAPFRERYVKVARYDGPQAANEPSTLPIDLRRTQPDQPVRLGENMTLELRRDSKPLKGLPLEVHHEKSVSGVWLRSDEKGQVRILIDKPGKWLVRGVELLPPTHDAESWTSRFITYSFEVAQP